jgi:hypothetical protein
MLRGSYRRQGRLVTCIEDAREAKLLIGASYQKHPVHLTKGICLIWDAVKLQYPWGKTS